MLNKWESYMKYVDASDKTIDTYKNWINRFFKETKLNPNEVRKADINLYLMDKKDKLSANTINLIIRSLSSFYKVCIDELGLIDIKNPCEGIKAPKIKNDNVNHHEALSKADVDRLINGCKNPRLKAVIALYFSTGIRLCELTNITLDQYLNRENDCITLEVTKGSKARPIFISTYVANLIDTYVKTRGDKTCPYLFVSNQNTQLERISLTRSLKKLATKVGLDEEIIKGLSSHAFRASYASHLINNGVPLTVVSKSMGHTTTNVTLQNYYHEDKGMIKDAMCGIL